MRKRLQIALAILLVGVVAVIVWQVMSADREPVYEGKPLSLWLEQYYQSLEDPGSPMSGGGTTVGMTTDGLGGEVPAKQAETAIRAIGTNALPVLLRMAKNHDSILRREWITLSYHQSLIPAQWRTDYVYRSMATWGFFILGPPAKPAMPALARLLDDGHPDVRASVAETLGSMGNTAREAIPALVKCLSDKDADTRSVAAEALKRIDPEAAARAGVK